MSLPKVYSHAIALSKKEKPRVLYLGTPSYDNPRIFDLQTQGFQKSGCSIMKMDLSEIPKSRRNKFNDSPGENFDDTMKYPSFEEMKEEVTKADIIMVSGGNTLYGLNRWKHFGMDKLLKEAANHSMVSSSSKNNDDDSSSSSPVFCGGSAGAICWFRYGHSDSMNPSSFLNPDPDIEEKNNWEYIKIQGLNLLPAICVPHYDVIQHNGIHRSIDSESIVRELCDTPCFGIDEDASFVLEDDKVKVIDGKSRDAKCYKKIFNSETQTMHVRMLQESDGYISTSDLDLYF